MNSTIVISADSARIIATAVRPQIKAYIEQNRAKYEAWYRAEYSIALDAESKCPNLTNAVVKREQGV
ncbi:MAG: hypothetical protein FWE05_04935 [Defluviitaleaceae bacterium]|nr:hypothetical protein [Defluviitaleaceae bacterium]